VKSGNEPKATTMNKQTLIRIWLSTVLTISIAASHALTPVVSNGSFEADPFNTSNFGYSLDLGGANPLTGWTTLNNGTYPWGLQNVNSFNGGPTPYGNQWVVVGNFGNGGTWIQQSISGFTIGGTYRLNFALASEQPGAGALAEVSFPSGSSTASQTFAAPLRGVNYWDTWGNFSMDFVANSSSVTVRFLGLAGLGFDPGIDNVSISEVPEPSNFALWVIAGFVMLIARPALRPRLSAIRLPDEKV